MPVDQMQMQMQQPIGYEIPEKVDPMKELKVKKLNGVEEVSELASRLEDLRGQWAKQYENMTSDLIFASGQQWDSTTKRARDARQRPSITVPFVRTYIDRIVNPLRLTPISLKVNLADEQLETVINGVLAGIELRSGGSEPYVQALTHAVTCGIGWLMVVVEKEDYYNGEPVIRIKSVDDPTNVYIDPYATSLVGYDAQYALHVGYMDKKRAEDMYGYEVTDSIDLIHRVWQVPADAVSDIVYYKLVHEDDECYCDIKRFVGGKVVSHVIMPTDELPIVPVYGDRNYSTDMCKWTGIVHKVRDAQSMVNYLASNALELTSLAPRQPLMVAEGQIEGYENIYKNLNVENYAYLPYRPVTYNGVQVPPPSRLDNQAQTQQLQALQAQTMGDLGRITGMPDAMMGQMADNAQSGVAITNRLSAAEIATAQYIDHLSQSIQRIGHIIMDMLPRVYSTRRSITFVNPLGQASRQMLDLSFIDDDTIEMLEIDISGGPTMENRRRESIAGLKDVMTMSPDLVPKLIGDYVKLLDLPGGDEMVRKLTGEDDSNQPDPEAMQALQTAEETINQQNDAMQYMHGIIADLQQQLLSSDRKIASDMYQAELKAQTDLEKASMDNQTKLAVEEIKAGQSQDKTAMEAWKHQTTMDAETRNSIMAMIKEVMAGMHQSGVESEIEIQPAAKLPMGIASEIAPKFEIETEGGEEEGNESEE